MDEREPKVQVDLFPIYNQRNCKTSLFWDSIVLHVNLMSGTWAS